MKYPGKLIVIEGVDGVGKQTQTKAVLAALTSQGKRVFTLSFPRYDVAPWGDLLVEYLHGDLGNPHELHPKLASIPYALDRSGARKELQDHLLAGDICILDRWTTSNMAFQSTRLPESARDNFITWLENLEYEMLELPRPDLVLFLDLAPEANQHLIHERSKKGRAKDLHEGDSDYLARVAETYRSLTKARKNWRRIDVTSREGGILPALVITEKLLKEVADIL